VGCGEGRLTRAMAARFPVPVRASDISAELIRENINAAVDRVTFVQRSIYDLDPAEDSADVVVCCEVLEHLEDPRGALESLRSLKARCYILSVPREPLWRILNMCRGKYVADFGNTPGHLNHWSSRGFLRLLQGLGFDVQERLQPLPWTMVSGYFGG
jgi:2-polyprenyl-3-methyl-5-hydroxy-6-metoxy-1,4-benzoquinol methylase